jgi:hypothetical protein
VSHVFSPLVELINGQAYAPHPADAALSLGRRFEGRSLLVIGGGGTGSGWTQPIQFDQNGVAQFRHPRSASFKRNSSDWREHLSRMASVYGWALLLVEQQWQATASAVSAASLNVSIVEQMLRVREAILDFGDDRLSEDAVRIAIDHPTMEGSIVAGVRAAIIDSLEREALDQGFQIAGVRVAAIALLERYIVNLHKQRRSPERPIIVFDGQTALLVSIKDSAFDLSEGGVSYLVNRPPADVQTQLSKRVNAMRFTKVASGRILVLGQRFVSDELKPDGLDVEFEPSGSLEAAVDESVRHDLRSSLHEMRTALPKQIRTVVRVALAVGTIALLASGLQLTAALGTQEKITASRLESFHYRNASSVANQRMSDLQKEVEAIHRSGEWVQHNYHAQPLVQELLNALPNDVTVDGMHLQTTEGISQAKLRFTLYGAEESQRVGLREMEARLYHLGCDHPDFRSVIMIYYRNTLLAGSFVVLLTLALFIATNQWQRTQRETLVTAQREAQHLAQAKQMAESSEQKTVRDAQASLDFEKAWDPFCHSAPPKDLGNHLRNTLATLATRAGLTAEGTTVPAAPKSYAVGRGNIKVQEVSVTVSSESLPALLTWLGEVESKFPYARVEALSLSSYASHSVQLEVTLYHPIDESAGHIWERSNWIDVAKK